MAEFPRAHSERELTTRQPVALRDDADIRNEEAGKSKTRMDAVKKVGDAAIQWAGTVEKIQKNTALYNAKTAAQEISNNAVLDQDMSNAPLYKKQLAGIERQVTQGLSQSVKNQLAPELNYITNMANVGIDYEFMKKTIKAGQAVLAQNIQDEIDNPTKNSEANIKGFLKEGIEDNLIDPKVAQKMEASALDDMRSTRFLKAVINNPKQAEEDLAAGLFGFKNPKEKMEAWQVLTQEKRILQTKTAKEFAELKYNHKLTEAMVDVALDEGKLDPDEAISLKKNINTKVVPERTLQEKVDVFNQLTAKRNAISQIGLDFTFDLSQPIQSSFLKWSAPDFKKKALYRAAVLDAETDGYIDEKTAKDSFLTTETTDSFNNDPTFLTAQKQLNALSDQYETKEQKAIARQKLSSELISLVREGLKPEDALLVASTKRIQADFPDVDAQSLLDTAKTERKPVWQIYKLTRKQ